MEITEKKGRKTGKTVLLIVAVLLVLLGAAGLLVTRSYVFLSGHLYRKDSASLDLRGSIVSVQQYEKLKDKLPACEILWDVPFGSERVDSTAETAVLSGLNSENLSELRYLSSLKELDARGAVLSEADYRAVRELLPDCHVLWSIPMGEGRYASDAESIEMSDFSVDDIALFTCFEGLTAADCRKCSCYDAILALREAYPDLEIQWQVPVSGEDYLQDAEEIRVDSSVTAAAELQSLLRYLPAVEVVSAPGCTYSDEEKLALAEMYPSVRFHWPLTLLGKDYSGEETELSFAKERFSDADYQELLSKLCWFSELKTVDMTGCNLSDEQVFTLADTVPETNVNWDFDFYGIPVNTMDTFLDLTGVVMETTDDVEAILPYMHHLTKVDMTDCGFSDEVMDGLNQKYENVRFVWTLYINRYAIRTDAVAFRATSDTHGFFEDADLLRLNYCTDMVCLDLGHRPIKSLDFLYHMPHIKYLLLLDCRANDLTAIGSLKELRFLELNRATAASLKPLLNCPSLEDLNITFLYTYFDDETYGQCPDIYETLMELDWVNRVWWSMGQMTDEQALALQEAHPDILYMEAYNWNQSNQDPWRFCRNYYEMRDMLGGPENGVYYMSGTGVIHCKIVDGVTYAEDEELPPDVD